MAWTKVGEQIRDGLNVAFTMVWGKSSAAAPTAAVAADVVVPLHAIVDASEVIINPATSDLQQPIASTARLLSAVGTAGDATNVKASAGKLYSIQGYNAAASVRYCKLYNSASVPTAGSGTPVKTLALPPSCAFVFDWPRGYTFTTGLGFTLVTGPLDTAAVGVTAGDILALNIDYT
jgi:hypothetical protein